jgi:hypothetical protein
MAWVAFCVFILGMLLFDLLLFNPDPQDDR